MNVLYDEVVDQYERTRRYGHLARLTDEEKSRIPESSNIPCVLEDRHTGKTYPATVYVAWEKMEHWDGSEYWRLMEYMMYWHYCGCHRRGSIIGDDEPDEPSERCDAARYLVKSVTDDRLPGVNLYFETPESLEEVISSASS